MVTQATSLTRSGVSDWLVQRVSAIILAVYVLVLLAIFMMNPELEYEEWRRLFETTWMRLFTLLAILATCAHGWVGMWTVGTDYLRERALGPVAAGLRMVFQVGSALVVIVYLLWGAMILWGGAGAAGP